MGRGLLSPHPLGRLLRRKVMPSIKGRSGAIPHRKKKRRALEGCCQNVEIALRLEPCRPPDRPTIRGAAGPGRPPGKTGPGRGGTLGGGGMGLSDHPAGLQQQRPWSSTAKRRWRTKSSSWRSARPVIGQDIRFSFTCLLPSPPPVIPPDAVPGTLKTWPLRLGGGQKTCVRFLCSGPALGQHHHTTQA